MDIVFVRKACEDIEYAKKHDQQTYKKIQQIVEYLKHNNPPYINVFHCEHFSYSSEFPNCYSMHITKKHRLLFSIDKSTIIILRAREHYGDH